MTQDLLIEFVRSTKNIYIYIYICIDIYVRAERYPKSTFLGEKQRGNVWKPSISESVSIFLSSWRCTTPKSWP